MGIIYPKMIEGGTKKKKEKEKEKEKSEMV